MHIFMIKYSWKATILHMNQFYITQTIPWEIFVTSEKTVTSINRAQFFRDYAKRNLHRKKKTLKRLQLLWQCFYSSEEFGGWNKWFPSSSQGSQNQFYIWFFFSPFFFSYQKSDKKCMWNQVTAIIMYMVHFHYCLLTMRFKWMSKISDPYFTSGNY